MSAIERRERVSVEVSPRNSFDLTMETEGGKFGLAVVEPGNYGHDTPEAAQDLLRTVMVAHLIAPYFPKVIETNFDITYDNFLAVLYHHYGYKPPRIQMGSDQIIPAYPKPTDADFAHIPNASAHSGGLDSVYRLMHFLKNGEKVLAVHLRNLNSKGNFAEARASRVQCESWDLPYQQIRLKNSSGNTNFDTMRTRDFFLALITAISASPHQAKKVVIEGGMSSDPKDAHFSEYAPAWEMFNQMLKDVGLDINVAGVDPGDIETIREILWLEKELGLDILPLVQNCFSAPFQVPSNRRKWERLTPVLAKNSPDHWCGSCLKCRRMTLGRIYYADPRLKYLSQGEIDSFVADTFDWMRKYPHNSDLLSGSFLEHLNALKD